MTVQWVITVITVCPDILGFPDRKLTFKEIICKSLNLKHRCTSKKNDDDGREPYDSGYNLANDTFAKLDRFSRKSSQGHGNLGNRNGSARSISVLPAPKVAQGFQLHTIQGVQKLVCQLRQLISPAYMIIMKIFF